jgi:hypothetical protein
MQRPRPRIGPAALLAALGILAIAAVAAVVGRPPTATGPPVVVTVMTRNLYLGGDILRPIRAVAGQHGPGALSAVGEAVHELRTVVDRTDFGVRSRLLAAEIVAARPDLVGLQEVALWRRGPLQLDQPGVPNSTEVDLDFLDRLLTDLTTQGVPYDVVQAQAEAEVEAPAFTSRTDPAARDVRLTLSDVILVRRDAGARIIERGSGHYQPRVERHLAGVPLAFRRGYAWAEVEVRGAQLRFVTTHLESVSPDVALAQAQELLAGSARPGPAPTVVVCDCNSDPLDDRVPPGSQVAKSAPYRALVDGGLADMWLARPDASVDPGSGATAVLSELVNDPAPTLDRRIDLVLARGTDSQPVTAVSGAVVGDESADRDAVTGLWPSDHAGVVLALRIG